MFWFLRDPDSDGVGVAFTSSTLDFSDPPSERATAFTQLAARIGVPVAVVRQVHGADVLDVDQMQVGTNSIIDLTNHEADALITTRAGIGLAVRVADCVPILLADSTAGVIAAAHAGRAGLITGVIDAVTGEMRRRGANAITAWVGPHLCSECYELPASIAGDASDRLGIAPSVTTWGTPSLDQAAAASKQLVDAGVTVVTTGGCTRTDPELHSWRRDDASAGRQVGIVWLA